MNEFDFLSKKTEKAPFKADQTDGQIVKMPIDILSLKLKRLTEKFVTLREENERLKAEISFYKDDSKESKKKSAENILLNQKHKKAILKLEKIIKMLESAGAM